MFSHLSKTLPIQSELGQIFLRISIDFGLTFRACEIFKQPGDTSVYLAFDLFACGVTGLTYLFTILLSKRRY